MTAHSKAIQTLMDEFEKTSHLRPVKSVRLSLPDGSFVEDKKALVYTDNDEYISTVGKNYRVINNEEVLRPAAKAIVEAGIDVTDANVVVQDSENYSTVRTLIKLNLPAHNIVVGDKDSSVLQVLLRNSYDGSWSFRTDVGAFRCACANGQVFGDTRASYSARHTSGFSTDAMAKSLVLGLQQFGTMKDVYEDMANHAVRKQDAVRTFLLYLNRDVNDKEKRAKMVDNPSGNFKVLTDNWNKYSSEMGENRWALYNALTDHATHSSSNELALIRNNAKIANLIPMAA